MTRFGLDLVTVNSISKLSVKDNFDLARQSKHSFAPTISKAMLAVTNLSNTHVGADKASRSNQDLWICGYDSSLEQGGIIHGILACIMYNTVFVFIKCIMYYYY